jgi:hypothetical protein
MAEIITQSFSDLIQVEEGKQQGTENVCIHEMELNFMLGIHIPSLLPLGMVR